MRENALPGMLEVSRSYQTEILKPSKILSARPTSLYQIFSTTEETKTAKLMFLVSVFLSSFSSLAFIGTLGGDLVTVLPCVLFTAFASFCI